MSSYVRLRWLWSGLFTRGQLSSVSGTPSLSLSSSQTSPEKGKESYITEHIPMYTPESPMITFECFSKYFQVFRKNTKLTNKQTHKQIAATLQHQYKKL